jgi:hypothetical protein
MAIYTSKLFRNLRMAHGIRFVNFAFHTEDEEQIRYIENSGFFGKTINRVVEMEKPIKLEDHPVSKSVKAAPKKKRTVKSKQSSLTFGVKDESSGSEGTDSTDA